MRDPWSNISKNFLWDWNWKEKIIIALILFLAEHAAPPKKPPRPSAQSQVGCLAGLNSGDSYNDGVKVHTHMQDDTEFTHWTLNKNMHTDILIATLNTANINHILPEEQHTHRRHNIYHIYTLHVYLMLIALISFFLFFSFGCSLSPSSSSFYLTLPYCWP